MLCSVGTLAVRAACCCTYAFSSAVVVAAPSASRFLFTACGSMAIVTAIVALHDLVLWHESFHGIVGVVHLLAAHRLFMYMTTEWPGFALSFFLRRGMIFVIVPGSRLFPSLMLLRVWGTAIFMVFRYSVDYDSVSRSMQFETFERSVPDFVALATVIHCLCFFGFELQLLSNRRTL